MSARPRIQTIARLAAALNLACVIPSGFSVSVLAKLSVRGDPAATAANILGAETLFRSGLVAEIVGLALFLGYGILLYDVLRAASRPLARAMLVFCVVGSSMQMLDTLADLATLQALRGGSLMASFTPGQTHELAYLFLRMHSLAYELALGVLGVMGFLIAAALFRARYLPRALGALMLVSAAGYLVFGLGILLAPAFGARIYPVVPMGTALFGDLALSLWLLVKGVDVPRWQEQLAEARAAEEDRVGTATLKMAAGGSHAR